METFTGNDALAIILCANSEFALTSFELATKASATGQPHLQVALHYISETEIIFADGFDGRTVRNEVVK